MGILDGVLGGGSQRSGGGMSPITMGLLGLLAYRTFQGKGRLADMLGTGATGQDGRAPGAGGGLGGLLGGLGGLLGGGAGAGAGGIGGMLSGGLADLVKNFQQAGQGDTADSWVQKGPNQAIAPPEVEKALGPEKIKWLMEQTGLPREELLAGLSRELPTVVDKLTPDGRLPTAQEAARFV